MFAEVKKKAEKNVKNSRKRSAASTCIASEKVAMFPKRGKSKSFGEKFSGEKFLGKLRHCSKTGHKQADCKVTEYNVANFLVMMKIIV